jgi:hypothetical protein
MPLSLEQYATYLDSRGLPWPAPPRVEPANAKPHLKRLPSVKVVLWNIYGTLLAIPFGELLFEHPTQLIMDVALDKTIEEFKMWGSMSRKPGAPAEYMRHIYSQELLKHKAMGSGGERYPEIHAERIWEAIIKKLFQKDYKFDTGFYGSINEYSRKVAYFFHASLQGVGPQPHAASTLQAIAELGIKQGLWADAQVFTCVQLSRALRSQASSLNLDEIFVPALRSLSHEVGSRKPSETLSRHVVSALSSHGIKPDEVLHVGSRISRDIVPARRLGMRTCLYAGDKASLEATADMLRDPSQRPDVLVTDLSQIVPMLTS